MSSAAQRLVAIIFFGWLAYECGKTGHWDYAAICAAPAIYSCFASFKGKGFLE